VQPLQQKIEEIVTNQLYKQDTEDNQLYTTTLCQLTHAIGTFSKGFPINSQVSDQTVTLFTKTLELILSALKNLPQHQELRSKVVFFLHRMVICLGPQIFRYLNYVIQILLINCGVSDLIGFILLINQIVSTFKDKVKTVIDQLLIPLIQRIIQHFNAAGEITLASEEERERADLKKTLLHIPTDIGLQ